MKTALKLLNNLVRVIYADEYNKIEIPMLRKSLFTVQNHFQDMEDNSMIQVFNSAHKRLDEREEADRLKPEELTELMLSKLTITELNDILDELKRLGRASTDFNEKDRLRTTYKKVTQALKRRTE